MVGRLPNSTRLLIDEESSKGCLSFWKRTLLWYSSFLRDIKRNRIFHFHSLFSDICPRNSCNVINVSHIMVSTRPTYDMMVLGSENGFLKPSFSTWLSFWYFCLWNIKIGLLKICKMCNFSQTQKIFHPKNPKLPTLTPIQNSKVQTAISYLNFPDFVPHIIPLQMWNPRW